MKYEVTFAWSSRRRLGQKSLFKIAGTIRFLDRLQVNTEAFRKMLGQPDARKERHMFLTQHLPVVSFPYICEKRFTGDCVQGLTFIGVLNIFGLEDDEQVEQVRSMVNRDPYTLLSFVGLSQHSLQVVYRYRFVTDGALIPLSKAPSGDYASLYQHVYEAVVDYYKKKIGIGNIDENGHMVSCITILAHDPDCMLNPEATHFSLVWDGTRANIVETMTGSRNVRSKNFVFCKDCDRKKLLFSSEEKAINFMKFNNDAILSVNKHAPVRPYFCAICGGYHLTSIENSENSGKAGFTEQIIEAYEQSKRHKKKAPEIEVVEDGSKIKGVKERIESSQKERKYKSACSQILYLLKLLEQEGKEAQIADTLEMLLDNHKRWLDYLLELNAGEPNIAEINYDQVNAFWGDLKPLRWVFEKYAYDDTKFNDLEVQAEPIKEALEVVKERRSKEITIVKHIHTLERLLVRIPNCMSIDWLSDAEISLKTARRLVEEVYSIDPQNEFLPNTIDQLITFGIQLEEKKVSLRTGADDPCNT